MTYQKKLSVNCSPGFLPQREVLPQAVAPPQKKIWSENNRKISITIDFALSLHPKKLLEESKHLWKLSYFPNSAVTQKYFVKGIVTCGSVYKYLDFYVTIVSQFTGRKK